MRVTGGKQQLCTPDWRGQGDGQRLFQTTDTRQHGPRAPAWIPLPAAREADSFREKQDPEPAGPAWSPIKRHPTEQNPPNEIPSLEKGKHQLGTELTWPSAYR